MPLKVELQMRTPLISEPGKTLHVQNALGVGHGQVLDYEIGEPLADAGRSPPLRRRNQSATPRHPTVPTVTLRTKMFSTTPPRTALDLKRIARSRFGLSMVAILHKHIAAALRDVTADGHPTVDRPSSCSGEMMTFSVGNAAMLFVEDCTMDSPNLDRAIRFKSNAVRGGVVENIFVRNVTVGTVGDAALQIDFVYEEGANRPHQPVVRNLVIENLTVANAQRVLTCRVSPARRSAACPFATQLSEASPSPMLLKEADVKLVDCVVEPKK